MLHEKNIKPYTGVEYDQTVEKLINGRKRRFRIFTYQAYDAFGLTGPEMNGVCIVDLDRNHILCDEIAKEQSGYLGASPRQVQAWQNLLDMDGADFQAWVNQHPRHRYTI